MVRCGPSAHGGRSPPSTPDHIRASRPGPHAHSGRSRVTPVRVAHRRAPANEATRAAPAAPPAASADPLPHRRQVARGDDRVGRQPVDLGLVEQQEERAVAADAVVGVVAVQPRLDDARLVQLLDALAGALAQLVELAELDRVGRAGLGARRLLADARGGRSTACT